MRHRRKRDIIIELTSLLDVIMIMIFMVMNENSKLVVQVQDELASVQLENDDQAGKIDDLTDQLAVALAQLNEGDREELLKRLHNAESQLNSYQAMDEVVTILTVELESLPNNTRRWLTYGINGDFPPERIPIRNDDEFKTAINRLAVFINDCKPQSQESISDSPTVYVVFSYKPYEVRYNDIQAIKDKIKLVIDGSKFIYWENEIQTDGD